MEAEQILDLMDSCWFERQIFRNKQKSQSFMHPKMDRSGEKSTFSRAQNLQVRSHSDRCIAVDFDADSPRSVIIKPKLQTIPSGEEFAEFRERREKPRLTKRRDGRRERGRRSGMSRSLSALEFEELKGFMDLGFVFNEEETINPNLVSIVPGLQKWRKTAAAAADDDDGGGEEVEMKGEVSRPYLSEAWGDLMSRRRGDGKDLVNWKIPSAKNEMDMKDHLKNWAHVVASTVR